MEADMSKRLDKIKTKWTDDRLRRLPGVSDSRQSLNKVFACLVQADPTSQHKMVDWLLTAWENKGFLWEDIRTGSNSKIAQTMSDFERLKSRLTKEDGTPDIQAKTLFSTKPQVKYGPVLGPCWSWKKAWARHKAAGRKKDLI